MNFELKAALVAMGYRRMNDEPEIWGKPVGYSLLAVKDENGSPVMFCHFRDLKGSLSLWNTRIIEPHETSEEYVCAVASLETDGRFNIGDKTKPLNFHNTEELTGLIL